MSIETRHDEKEMLFDLLTLSKSVRENAEIKKIIKKLMAKMEPEDVKIVKEHVYEFEESK